MSGASQGIAGVVGLALSFVPGIGPLLSLAFNVAFQLIGGLLFAPTPPNLDSFKARASGQTQQVRQPITSRRRVYGEQLVSGPLVFVASSDGDSTLHLVIALAAHECENIGTIMLNDDPIYPSDLDPDGRVNNGKYGDLVWIKKHLGSPTQAADSDLIGVSGWTSAHRGRGICYIYVKMIRDQDVFPAQIPNVAAWVRGAKLLDPRDGGTRYSDNLALILYDYLRRPVAEGGAGFKAEEIDVNFLIAAANTCDEFVDTTTIGASTSGVDADNDLLELTGEKLEFQRGDRVQLTTSGSLPGGLAAATDYYVIPVQRKSTDDTAVKIQLAASHADALADTPVALSSEGSGNHTVTKYAEPRYAGGGVVDSSDAPRQTIREILSGMAGRAAFVGASWKIYAGVWRSPTLTLDENHLRKALSFRTKHSRRERFNAVKGTYVSPLNDGQPSDYPPVINAFYQGEDGDERIFRDLDLPFTPRPHTAQRIAKIELERHRQQVTCNYPVNLSGLQLQVGDTVYVNNTELGWDRKVFEVGALSLVGDEGSDGVPVIGVDLELTEIAASVFDWNSGEETAVDPTPNTTLPNPFDVRNPTNLQVTTENFVTETGTTLRRLRLSWDAPADAFVTGGGRIEVQFKRSAEVDWSDSYWVDGNATRHSIPTEIQIGINYDVRIRSVNQLGQRRRPAAWVEIFAFTGGADSGGADAQQDYRFVAEAADVFFDRGAIGGEVDLNLDYGGLT